MKTRLIFVAALMTVASAGAFADSLYYSTNTIGNTTYYSGDVSGYSNRIEIPLTTTLTEARSPQPILGAPLTIQVMFRGTATRSATLHTTTSMEARFHPIELVALPITPVT